jgi:hypothetical protein
LKPAPGPPYNFYKKTLDLLIGFAIRNGVYEALTFDAQNRLISQRLGLALVRWQGIYKGIETLWLRWETLEGVLVPTAQEAAEQQAAHAEQRANQAEQRAARLADKLRAMGINPDDIE